MTIESPTIFGNIARSKMLGQLIQMTLMSRRELVKDADASAVGDAEEQLKASPKRNEQGSMRGKDEGEGEGEAAAISTSHAWKMQLIFLMRATCQWSSGAVGRQDGDRGWSWRWRAGYERIPAMKAAYSLSSNAPSCYHTPLTCLFGWILL